MFKKAFTLIELLVVITIMAIIIGLAAVNYQKTVQLGRDSKRKADIEQIRQALETYRSEYSSYPANLSILVSTGFIGELPADPKGGSYLYLPSGSPSINYSICAYLEIPPSTTSAPCNTQSCTLGTCNYQKASP
jgi:general secretion pathway protein G